MKTLRIIIGIILLTLIVIQFFPTMKNIENEVPATDLLLSHKAPSHVATLVQNACYDCHSNNTQYPWYNKVQPFAWALETHIQKAKTKLNFNEFDTYPASKQKKALEKIKFVLEENKMPLTGYKILHAEGRLSKDEQKAIIDWVDEELKVFQ